MTEYNLAMLLLRLALGLTLAAHGYQKFFKGGRLPGTAAWFDSIGMKPGAMHARMAASTEVMAGLGLAAGVFTPLCAAAFVGVMTVAAYTVHRGNFMIVRNGWEYNFILAVAAVAVAMLGPGRYSLDHLLDIANNLDGYTGLAISAGLGLLGAVAQLLIFYKPEPKTPDAQS